MKILALVFALLFVSAPVASVYDFKLKTIDGGDFSLKSTKAKKS
jgi:glutathione peroxidase